MDLSNTIWYLIGEWGGHYSRITITIDFLLASFKWTVRNSQQIWYIFLLLFCLLHPVSRRWDTMGILFQWWRPVASRIAMDPLHLVIFSASFWHVSTADKLGRMEVHLIIIDNFDIVVNVAYCHSNSQLKHISSRHNNLHYIYLVYSNVLVARRRRWMPFWPPLLSAGGRYYHKNRGW